MGRLQILDKIKDDDLVIKKGLLIIDMGSDIKESKKIEKRVLDGNCYVTGLIGMGNTRGMDTKFRYP